MIGNLTAIVVVAVRDDRITVVGGALDAIQLVAAFRSHFHDPEAAVEIEGEPERIAVAQRPDLPIHADVIDERVLADEVDEGVVVGNRSIVVEAQDLAHIRLHVLRGRELLPIARRDPQIALVVEP